MRTNQYFCENCNIEKLFDDLNGVYVCTSCGEISTDVFVDYPEYNKDGIKISEPPKYQYKKNFNFNDNLRRICGIEQTEIDKELVQRLKAMFKTKPNNTMLRKTLIEMNRKKYIRSIPQLSKLCWNIELPFFHQNTVTKFNHMFDLTVKACNQFFQKKHFIQFKYLIYQYVILLDKKEYLKYIPKMKNNSTIYHYNKIWKKVCQINNWKYVEYKKC